MTAADSSFRPCGIQLLLLLLLLSMTRCFPTRSGGAPNPPNIILLLVDDAGFDDISPQRPPPQGLVHIESLALHGASFSRAYVTAPQCSPSRAAILTGLYQNRFGHESNAEFLAALSHTSTRLLPQYLPPAYRSAMIGKWNLGDVPHPPQQHGFNETFLYRDCETMYGTHAKKRAQHPQEPSPQLTQQQVQARLRDGRDRRHCTSLMFERATQFITRHAGGTATDSAPFMLYLSPLSPHPPFIFPPAYDSVFDSLPATLGTLRRKVLTMMHEIDDGLGALLGTLRDSGALDNTLLMLLSDNGAPNIFLPGEQPNFPLRGHKGDLLEGGEWHDE
mmetsp:Transcript_32131/g.59816  ORF Transcript_32131/g.59816 Transcript_32131/m.59816 type:complete len:333 (+) Transcript_32131:94-1092(+)